MHRKHRKKLSLNKETLKNLDAATASRVVGGIPANGGGGGQSATSGGQVCCSFPSDATCDLPPLRTCNSQGPCWCPPPGGGIAMF